MFYDASICFFIPSIVNNPFLKPSELKKFLFLEFNLSLEINVYVY